MTNIDKNPLINVGYVELLRTRKYWDKAVCVKYSIPCVFNHYQKFAE